MNDQKRETRWKDQKRSKEIDNGISRDKDPRVAWRRKGGGEGLVSLERREKNKQEREGQGLKTHLRPLSYSKGKNDYQHSLE